MFTMEEKTSDKLILKDKFYDWELSPFLLNNGGDLIFIVICTCAFCIIIFLVDKLLVKNLLITHNYQEKE